jgi:hypothetical protein
MSSNNNNNNNNNNNRRAHTNIAEFFGSYVADDIRKENAAVQEENAALRQELVRSTVLVEWAGPPDPSVKYADQMRRDEQQGWVVYGELTYLAFAAAQFPQPGGRPQQNYELTGKGFSFDI